jgi:hypothetical protein
MGFDKNFLAVPTLESRAPQREYIYYGVAVLVKQKIE